MSEAARRPNRPWDHLLVWPLDRWSREERFSKVVLAIEELEVREWGSTLSRN